MVNVYIISGFLGAGKTTIIKHILNSQRLGKVMLLENEFGEIGIDGNLFDEGLQITEINSGCICCSLKGDLERALNEIMSYNIDTLLIEPSGVGKLSEIMNSVAKAKDLKLVSHICVVDAKKALSYHRNYKEFFDDQVKAANSILCSKTELVSEERLNDDLKMLRELNPDATIVTTDYKELEYDQLFAVLNENVKPLTCTCEEETCECHCHDHEHHHHHHADEVFETYGFETIRTFTKDELQQDLLKIKDAAVRAKGIVKGEDIWYYFDLTGDDIFIKEGKPSHTGLVTVIGKGLNEEELQGMFCL